MTDETTGTNKRLVIDGRYDINGQLKEVTDDTKSLRFSLFNLWQGNAITLRRESRKGTNRRYWYAYKKIDGKLKKVYVGKRLTSEKLVIAWNKLTPFAGVQS